MKIFKKILCLIISATMLCLTACSAQTEPENLARTIEVLPRGYETPATIEFNEKGLIVAEKNMPYNYEYSFTYDEDGKITEMHYVNDRHERTENAFFFDYYSNGDLKRSTQYTAYNDEPFNYDEPVSYKEFIYDNDRLEKILCFEYSYKKGYQEVLYTCSDEFYYTETEDSLIVRSRNISFDGSYGESTSTYDKDGKLILEDYPGGAGRTEYIYDEKGNLIKKIDGDNETVTEYYYENGLLVKSVCTKDDFGYEEGGYREYENFDNGNIKLIYSYSPDGYLAESNACILIETSDELKGNYSDFADYLF